MRFSPLPLVSALLLAWAQLAPAANGNEPIPVSLDARIYLNFDFKAGADAMLPRAPWYTYFPADPNIGGPGPMTQFPNWTGAGSALQGFSYAPAPTPMRFWAQPAAAYRPVIQPAGYYVNYYR